MVPHNGYAEDSEKDEILITMAVKPIHCAERHGKDIASWILWSFGCLSRFYSELPASSKAVGERSPEKNVSWQPENVTPATALPVNVGCN